MALSSPRALTEQPAVSGIDREPVKRCGEEVRPFRQTAVSVAALQRDLARPSTGERRADPSTRLIRLTDGRSGACVSDATAVRRARAPDWD
jgi:hypothetical protein